MVEGVDRRRLVAIVHVRGAAVAPSVRLGVTWAFFVEPIGPERSRFVSRYRCATSDDVATRLSLGPTLVEPIGFAMDRLSLVRRCDEWSELAVERREDDDARLRPARIRHVRLRLRAREREQRDSCGRQLHVSAGPHAEAQHPASLAAQS